MSHSYSTMGWGRDIETPLSDAMVLRMLVAAERELAALERAPKRRHVSVKQAMQFAHAVTALTKRLSWLMPRYEAVVQAREKRAERTDAARKELKRRLDNLFAAEDAARAEKEKPL